MLTASQHVRSQIGVLALTNNKEQHMSSETFLQMENAKAGRFLPKWRYWLGYSLMVTAWILGTALQPLDLPWWGRGLVITGLGICYVALFVKYKQRSIT